MATYVPRMTRKEQVARQKKIAAAVKSGQSIEHVANEYKVVIPTVYAACRKLGVQVPDARRSQITEQTMSVVADFQVGKSAAEIAEKYGLTRQRVHAIKKWAAGKGIKFPK